MSKSFYIIEDITNETALRFAKFQETLQADDEVDLYLTSYGGDIFSGSAIFQMLQGWQKQGVVFNALIYGLCASAASDIALACDSVGIANTGAIMIHSAWRADGETDRGIEIANSAQLSVIKKRVPEYDVDALKEDRWFTAEEAREIGLVDYIFDYDDSDSDVIRIAAKYLIDLTNEKNGGAIMAKKCISAKAEEIKKEEVIEEEKAEEIIEEEKKEEVEEVKEDRDPSPEDMFERIAERLEEVAKDLDDVKERLRKLEGGEIEAECGGDDRENSRMKAVYDRIQAICKPAQPKQVKALQISPKDEMERINAKYPNLAELAARD